MYKKLLSLFVLFNLILPISTFAFTQGYTLSGFGSDVNYTYCLTSENTYTNTTNGVYIFYAYPMPNEYQIISGSDILYNASTPESTWTKLMFGMNPVGGVVSVDCDSLGGGGSVVGGIISTDTTSNIFSQLGEVTTDTFGGALPYMLLFMGLYVVFYIIKAIRGLFVNKKTGRVLKDYKGYHKLKGRKGQDIGWEKDSN